MEDGIILENKDVSEIIHSISGGLLDLQYLQLDNLQMVLSGVQKGKALIITEGKTDWKHLKAAMQSLGITNDRFTLLEYKCEMGDNQLNQILKNLSKLDAAFDSFSLPTIIGIFDRDNNDFIKEYKDTKSIGHSKNVYAFCLPELPNCTHPAVENYYPNKVREITIEGRKLFVAQDFQNEEGKKMSMTKCGKYCAKNIGKPDKVFKTEDGQELNIALSKNEFAQHILDKQGGFSDLSKSDFKKFPISVW